MASPRKNSARVTATPTETQKEAEPEVAAACDKAETSPRKFSHHLKKITNFPGKSDSETKNLGLFRKTQEKSGEKNSVEARSSSSYKFKGHE